MRIGKFLSGWVLLLASAFAGAQEHVPVQLPPAQVLDQTPALTRGDLEGWLDGLLPYAMRTGEMAGAVVVVVKNGDILLAKGYGYADVDAGKPVDPRLTLFRPGSISKLFTWTAVMQLVEQGKLDLDEDLNRYLDFEIPAYAGKPITMRNVMTHTTGFEESGKHLFSRSQSTLPSLETLIKDVLPRRVYPPGEVVAYSNYAASLAGYVVQRISGQPFDDYVEQHLLRPLGMARSTFRQPLPPGLAGQMANGYRNASDPPMEFELVGPAPAGSLSATGTDMAAFMLAHLQQGQYRGVRILKPETVAVMHATAHAPTPPLNGMALGFYREDRNGRKIVGHAGDTRAFHSDLHLFPDEGVGLFVSVTGGARGQAASKLRKGLLDGFVNRYFPAESGNASPARLDADSVQAHAQQMVGRYRISRSSYSNFMAALSLAGQLKVDARQDGTLVTQGFRDLAGQPMHWREVEPYVWRELNGDRRLAAVVENGQVVRIGTDAMPPVAVGLRVAGWESAGWNLPLLAFTLLVLVAALAWWLVAALAGKANAIARPAERQRKWLQLGTVAGVLFFIGWGIVAAQLLRSPVALDGGLDPFIRVLHVLGVLLVPAALHALWAAFRAWREPRGTWMRVGRILLAAALVATVWFAFAFRLVTAGLNY